MIFYDILIIKIRELFNPVLDNFYGHGTLRLEYRGTLKSNI